MIQRWNSAPSLARLAALEASAFTALRRHCDLVTVVDDELPELDEWLAARSGSKN